LTNHHHHHPSPITIVIIIIITITTIVIDITIISFQKNNLGILSVNPSGQFHCVRQFGSDVYTQACPLWFLRC
jgi:hypothetical protein